MESEIKAAYGRVAGGEDLSRETARGVFEQIMEGDVPDAMLGALLGALVTKGEAVSELIGAAEAMRARVTPIACDGECIDTCGTGGDGISTFNVSTTAAIVAAAAGAIVAKHGNRSTSRASGSTEVLHKLGIETDADVSIVEQSLREVGIGYLNARCLHPAMRHAARVRQAIRVRTIFNLLGPLTNPAGAKRQLLGVPRLDLTETMAHTLHGLGATHVWVVHGGDGLCDVTVTAETHVVELKDGDIKRFTIAPEEVGLSRAPLASLLVKSPAESADIVLGVLAGKLGPPRDHTLMNAGAALIVAGLAGDLAEGVNLAAKAIDGGAARETLSKWRRVAGLGKPEPQRGQETP